MKNITISIEDDVLRAARRVAAEQDTTVNALVRAFLTDLVGRKRRVESALMRMQEIRDEAGMEVGPRTCTRDDLHER